MHFASTNQVDGLGKAILPWQFRRHYSASSNRIVWCYYIQICDSQRRLGKENVMPCHAFVTMIDVLTDIQKNCDSLPAAPDKVLGRQ